MRSWEPSARAAGARSVLEIARGTFRVGACRPFVPDGSLLPSGSPWRRREKRVVRIDQAELGAITNAKDNCYAVSGRWKRGISDTHSCC